MHRNERATLGHNRGFLAHVYAPVELQASFSLPVEQNDSGLIKPVNIEWIKIMPLHQLVK